MGDVGRHEGQDAKHGRRKEWIGRALLPKDEEDERENSTRHENPAHPIKRADARDSERRTRQSGRHQRSPDHVDGGRESWAGPEHEQHERDRKDGEGYVDPEHPAPIEVSNYQSSPQRADHAARLRRRPDDAQWQGALSSGKEVSDDCDSNRHQRAGAERLKHPSGNHPVEALCEGNRNRPDSECHDRQNVETAVTPHVGDSPDERHPHQIAEQVARYRPGCAVELGDGHLHVQHDLRQHRHDDGLVVRRDEHSEAHGYKRNVRRHTLADAVQDVHASRPRMRTQVGWLGTSTGHEESSGGSMTTSSLKKDSTMTRSASSTSDGVTAPIKRTSSR